MGQWVIPNHSITAQKVDRSSLVWRGDVSSVHVFDDVDPIFRGQVVHIDRSRSTGLGQSGVKKVGEEMHVVHELIEVGPGRKVDLGGLACAHVERDETGLRLSTGVDGASVIGNASDVTLIGK